MTGKGINLDITELDGWENCRNLKNVNVDKIHGISLKCGSEQK
jgi:hypothetical protein